MNILENYIWKIVVTYFQLFWFLNDKRFRDEMKCLDNNFKLIDIHWPFFVQLGTFICVDQIMNNLDSVQSSDLDIFYAVYQLRKQRLVSNWRFLGKPPKKSKKTSQQVWT